MTDYKSNFTHFLIKLNNKALNREDMIIINRFIGTQDENYTPTPNDYAFFYSQLQTMRNQRDISGGRRTRRHKIRKYKRTLYSRKHKCTLRNRK